MAASPLIWHFHARPLCPYLPRLTPERPRAAARALTWT